MKLRQLSKLSSSFSLPNKNRIVYIGIEHLNSEPIYNDNGFSKMFSCNLLDNEEFKINECNILEFGNLIEAQNFISFNNLDDYTYIIIGYEEFDE